MSLACKGSGVFHILYNLNLGAHDRLSFACRKLDGLERFWSHLGYHIFVGISGDYMSRGVPKRVLTLVRSNMSARVLFDSGLAKGAVLGVAVDDLLIINSYAADTTGQLQQTQAGSVEELRTCIGRLVWPNPIGW